MSVTGCLEDATHFFITGYEKQYRIFAKVYAEWQEELCVAYSSLV
jgi:hypothetical protein